MSITSDDYIKIITPYGVKNWGPIRRALDAHDDHVQFARDIIQYLDMKLDGWRRVDGLPENHAIIMTAVGLRERAIELLPNDD